MENIKENLISFYLPEAKKTTLSLFRLNLLKDELKKINEKVPMAEGDVDLQLLYAVYCDQGIEVEFYIRNNSRKTVNFEIIPLVLIKNDIVVTGQLVDLKEIGDVPPKSAVPCSVVFTTGKDLVEDLTNIKIGFSLGNQYEMSNTRTVDIENIPKNLKYKYRKSIESFASSLNRLRKNTVDFNAYNVSYDGNENLNVTVLVRNGYDSEIEIQSLPINVFNKDDILVYHGVFNSSDMKVKANSAKLFIIEVNSELLPIKDADFSKFRVDFN
ncbi:SLAP domain-containing protein [Clostridium thermarum]|uniref:SLAP domain-containing protein n=1 Tax=Clostridium thermarum TaxID=1716543 RepID=UPI0013D011A1|nr:SLAP domain-containing protein [Clostridium thermarum]